MHETTLKTLDAGEGRVGGYLVIWGSSEQRDLQGEYFTPETDLGLDWYEQRPVLYHHGLDGSLKAAVIGVIDTLRPDSTGLWAEAQLDLRQRYVRTIQKLVERGILGWSSGSLPHLVDVEDDGRIKRWPIVEGSLTPAPAEPRRTDVRTLKSAYDALGLDTERLNLSYQSSVVAFQNSDNRDDDNGDNLRLANLHQQPASLSPSLKGVPMQNEPLLNETEKPARKRLPIGSKDDALKSHISVSSPYDNLDATDLLHGYVLLRSAKGFQGVTERYANALAHKVNKAGLTALKSDELTYSTQVGFGDEWVPDLWSAQIWNKARLENVILPLFRSIEMPSNPFELPIESRGTPDCKN